ncbi:hypothetical protein MP228_000041 [Amoeboaphelidium protococcarum]|nr:hypothetical protein MP228_000041 [Amoeboaphelidium protococcarum]
MDDQGGRDEVKSNPFSTFQFGASQINPLPQQSTFSFSKLEPQQQIEQNKSSQHQNVRLMGLNYSLIKTLFKMVFGYEIDIKSNQKIDINFLDSDWSKIFDQYTKYLTSIGQSSSENQNVNGNAKAQVMPSTPLQSKQNGSIGISPFKFGQVEQTPQAPTPPAPLNPMALPNFSLPQSSTSVFGSSVNGGKSDNPFAFGSLQSSKSIKDDQVQTAQTSSTKSTSKIQIKPFTFGSSGESTAATDQQEVNKNEDGSTQKADQKTSVFSRLGTGGEQSQSLVADDKAAKQPSDTKSSFSFTFGQSPSTASSFGSATGQQPSAQPSGFSFTFGQKQSVETNSEASGDKNQIPKVEPSVTKGAEQKSSNPFSFGNSFGSSSTSTETSLTKNVFSGFQFGSNAGGSTTNTQFAASESKSPSDGAAFKFNPGASAFTIPGQSSSSAEGADVKQEQGEKKAQDDTQTDGDDEAHEAAERERLAQETKKEQEAALYTKGPGEEEEDIQCAVRCKAFQKFGNEYRDMSLSALKVNKSQADGSYRLLARQYVTNNILINSRINQSMAVTKTDKPQIFSVMFPAAKDDGKVDILQYSFRCKSGEEVERMIKAIEKARIESVKR